MQSHQVNTHAGDTKLHESARSCSSFLDFESKINFFDQKTKIEYALTPNDQGKLPFEVINSNLSESEKTLISSKILEFALARKIKPLHEPVSFEEMIEKYQLKPGTILYDHFKHACELVNETRAHILNKTSLTHPHINGISINERQKIADKLCARRNKDLNSPKKVLLREASFEKTSYSDVFSDQGLKIKLHLTSLAYDHLYSAYDKDLEVYNCEEMARFTYYSGKKRGLNIIPYHYAEGKGDHVLAVIFDNKDEKKCCLDACTGNEIICDSWSGDVRLGNEYRFLGDSRRFLFQGKIFNLITEFNPNFNKLEQYFFPTQGMVYTFRLNNKNNIDLIFSKIIQDLSSPKEIFLFLDIIKNNLSLAIKKHLISEKTICSWPDPAVKLKEYFSYDDRYLPLLTELYSKDEKLFKKKLIKAITKYSVNPNQADTSETTALYVAAAHNYTEIVEFLLKNKANPNKVVLPNFETPLFIAAQQGYENTVDALLACPNIRFISIENSKERFIAFAKDRKVEIQQRMEKHIEYQIKKGESVFSISISPSEIARIMGHTEIAKKIDGVEKRKNIKTIVSVNYNLNCNLNSNITMTKPLSVNAQADILKTINANMDGNAKEEKKINVNSGANAKISNAKIAKPAELNSSLNPQAVNSFTLFNGVKPANRSQPVDENLNNKTSRKCCTLF